MSGRGRVKSYCQLELLFLAILGQYFLAYLPTWGDLHDWCATPYFLTYDFGFISRGLVGSILKLFFPYLSARLLFVIIGSCLLMLCLVTAVFLGRAVRFSEPDSRDFVFYLALLFCINPGSVAFLFSWVNYGRLDLFLILITLAASLCIQKGSLVPVPFLAGAGVMIHQVYVFLYFPTLLLLLIYHGWGEKKSRRIQLITIFTLLLVTILFAYLQIYGKISSDNSAAVLQVITSRTDAVISARMIDFEYFLPLSEHLHQLVWPSIKINSLKMLVVLVLLAPLIYIFFSLWRQTIKNASTAVAKAIYWAMALNFFMAVPVFLLTIDWGRWLAAIIICQFVLLFSLISQGDENVRCSLSELQAGYVRHGSLYLFVLCFLGAAGKFEAAEVLAISSRIVVFTATMIKSL